MQASKLSAMRRFELMIIITCDADTGIGVGRLGGCNVTFQDAKCFTTLNGSKILLYCIAFRLVSV